MWVSVCEQQQICDFQQLSQLIVVLSETDCVELPTGCADSVGTLDQFVKQTNKQLKWENFIL